VIRGEIWTASARQGYAGKPRPVVIVQDDRFDATDSITFCPFTSVAAAIPLLRIPVSPNAANGLSAPSSVMVDKITTAHKSKLDRRIGAVSPSEMREIERALLVFLGLTG